MDRRVVIDVGPGCARSFGPNDAAIVVDVIRSMTTLITAAALGRRCFPVPSLDVAHAVARGLRDPLLVGELGGARPRGFDLTNSPAELARRPDVRRPMVLLSSSGTKLLDEVRGAGAVYPACLRNQRAVAQHVRRRHGCITVLGAATRGQFREEDQLCCAQIAAALVADGFAADGDSTAALIERWADARPDVLSESRSARYLRATGQLDDLDFILSHIDDLDRVFRLHAGEIVDVEVARLVRAVGG